MITLDQRKLLNLENVIDGMIGSACAMYNMINFVRQNGQYAAGFPEDMEKLVGEMEYLRSRIFQTAHHFWGKYDNFRANQDTRMELLKEKENGNGESKSSSIKE